MVEFPNAVVLTGGIATGKSTTASLLRLFGFRIIDADTIAHRVLDAEAQEIARLFGAEYVKDGRVNRKALGQLVFADAAKRRQLENLLHPKIRKEILERAKAEERFGVPYFVDIPLFFERGDYPFEKVAVVYAPRELQLKRLMERDGLDEAEALQRIGAQMDIEKKRARAHYLVDNTKDLRHLQDEVERLAERIKDDFGLK
jgi:dephospho-CoA kinase